MLKLSLASLVVALLSVTSFAAAQSSTAFTYQGELGTAGSPYTGTADLRFRLYNAFAGTNQIGPEISVAGTTVTNGRFTSELDFASSFDAAQPLWLEIDVRTPGGSGPYTTLSPRQRIAATPLAQAIVGMPITRAGPRAIDQDQSQNRSPVSSNVDAFAPCWQSFTAGTSGALDQLDVWANALEVNQLTVTVHLGVGISGPVLGSVSVPAPNGLVQVQLPNISVSAGSVYTFHFTGAVLLEGSTSAIPGAQGHMGANGADWRFRTFVSPFDLIHVTASNAVSSTTALAAMSAGTATTALTANTATSAASVPWSGVSGIPANVSGAFSPWFTTTGGISYLSGVGVGTTAPKAALHVKANAGVFNIEGGDHAFIQFYPFGFASGRSAYIGTPSANSVEFTVANLLPGGILNLQGAVVRIVGTFLNNSDARDKHDVRPIDNALALVEQLRGVRYRWNARSIGGEALPPGEQLGFLAQDVEKVIPEAVATTPDGRKGVSYVSLVPVLAQAIKEQQATFQAELGKRDAQVARLAAENAELKARLDRMERLLNAASK